MCVDKCFNPEYNGRSMIVHGMGGCGKSKLIASIDSVVRSCGKQVLLMATIGYTESQIGGRRIHGTLWLSSQALQKCQDMFKKIVG